MFNSYVELPGGSCLLTFPYDSNLDLGAGRPGRAALRGVSKEWMGHLRAWTGAGSGIHNHQPSAVVQRPWAKVGMALARLRRAPR